MRISLWGYDHLIDPPFNLTLRWSPHGLIAAATYLDSALQVTAPGDRAIPCDIVAGIPHRALYSPAIFQQKAASAYPTSNVS